MAEEWTRNMPWRQGHLLPPEALSLLENPRQHEYAVVISHDCDLANENLELEPHVEVLLGGVGNSDQSGNLRWGKSPRNIQLEFNNPEGTTRLLNFNINQKRMVAKQDLCRYQPQQYVLSEAECDAFSRWLASRYRRSAFPDAFNDALAQSKLGRKLEGKLGVPGGAAITVVLFELEEQSSWEFGLTIVLVYRDEDRKEEVKAVAKSIEQLFDQLENEASGGGARIILYDCEAVPESQVTLQSMRKLKKWEKDYLSLRSSPTGEMMDEV